jgi:poly(A) polymerase
LYYKDVRNNHTRSNPPTNPELLVKLFAHMKNQIPLNNITHLTQAPDVIPRDQHNISRSDISANALKVLYRLKNAGYKSYLVGGAVRDLLLGLRPKDFDVVTDARPEQVRELFRNCRLIGRRFRLAHVHYGDEVIEVSTFRAAHHVSSGEGHGNDGRILRDNVYGDIDNDVWRRDFTVNALFYNIEDFSIIDYVGGITDIELRQLRLIGDPAARYREDPVRMLRAIRFAVKLGFNFHSSTAQPIADHEKLLETIPSARLFEEFMKLFMNGHALQTFHQLCKYDLFRHLFSETNELLLHGKDGIIENLLDRVFSNTDTRVAEGKPVTPAFIIAALLWFPVIRRAEQYQGNGLAELDAIQLASDAVISRQVSSIAIPRRYTLMAREIWGLQYRLTQRRGNRPYRLVTHPKFRAAYDFMLLRAEAGENLRELIDWWTNFMQLHKDLLPEPVRHGKSRSKHYRRRKR